MDDDENVRRIFWYVFAGTKGGVTRLRIVDLLTKRPFNLNQLSGKLGMDYKSIQHNIRVLEENRIIVSEGGKYGALYFLSPLFKKSMHIFDEIQQGMQGG
ncbi:MAG: winged helix-turn-helix transcriptional regulator [Candidatus Aenigmarchaeota archaeon]|nr:winged helix-turn-helix transcriptional regulator [Candidatus Aenigmarchaeota archaeon]